jgi:hypothetical protein
MGQSYIEIYMSAPHRLAPSSRVTVTSTRGGTAPPRKAKNIEGVECNPAPSLIRCMSLRYMPALISVCSVAALAASFCCSAAAIDAFSALVSFIDCMA